MHGPHIRYQATGVNLGRMVDPSARKVGYGPRLELHCLDPLLDTRQRLRGIPDMHLSAGPARGAAAQPQVLDYLCLGPKKDRTRPRSL